MSRHLRLALALGLIAAAGLMSSLDAAQFSRLTNPRFAVRLTHPPEIILKGVQKVAVMDFPGECGDELSQRLLQTIAKSGRFEVIDRANLETILREQGLQMSGAVGGQAAVKVGQLLGPAAMFTGRATSCAVEDPGDLIVRNTMTGAVKSHVRRVTASMNASVSLIDFTTGRQHAGRFIEAKAVRQTEAAGPPAPPNRQEVMNAMYQDAVAKVMRLISPWDEVVQITVYDDDDAAKFRLKPMVEQMKRGDLRGAAEGLQSVIDEGGGPKTTDKDRARAYYDLGIALMYSDQLDRSLPLLDKAQSFDPKDTIIQEGVATARRMSALRDEQRRLEASAVVLGAPAQGAARAGSAAAATSSGDPEMTNADVIELVRAKMSDSVILAKIKSSRTKFDTSTKALIALKQAGASEAVVLAVTNAGGRGGGSVR
jgi:hypothetical protein